jgi:hypothetical protein
MSSSEDRENVDAARLQQLAKYVDDLNSIQMRFVQLVAESTNNLIEQAVEMVRSANAEANMAAQEAKVAAGGRGQ